MTFGHDLAQAMSHYGPLSVGVDPSREELSSWGMPDTPEGVMAYSMSILEAAANNVAAVKFQVAFFERYGARGFAVLEHCLDWCAGNNVLSIADAKRGDIGSTMNGYAEAFLMPGSPLEADAVTLSPYLGFESLRPAVDLAHEHRKGIFVLCLTSNPEGASVQHATHGQGVSVARAIAEAATAENASADGMGSVGLVIGATVGEALRDLHIDVSALRGPILAPGIGAQGATAQDAAEVFGEASSWVLAHQGRSLSSAGPIVEKLRSAMVVAAHELRTELQAS